MSERDDRNAPPNESPEAGDMQDDAAGRAQQAQATAGRWPVDRLLPVLEAILFAAADPMPLKRLQEIVDGSTPKELRAALDALQESYRRRGIRLVEVAGGWQLRTAPEQHAYVRRLFRERPFRLTRAAIETLAIVAYRQPVTRAEIEAIRGVDASGVLESLVTRRLIRVAGRRDVPGRPLVYVTTAEFLELFGLKDLRSLPTLPEMGDEIAAMAEQSGFEDSAERDAPIIPLEDDALEAGATRRVQVKTDLEEDDSDAQGAASATVATTGRAEQPEAESENANAGASERSRTLH